MWAVRENFPGRDAAKRTAKGGYADRLSCVDDG